MKGQFVAATAIAFFAVHAQAECAYPKAPGPMPNGSTASEAEMITAMKAVRKFNDEVEAYLTCADEEANSSIVAAGDNAEVKTQIKDIASKKHDAAVAELQSVADDFNTQLKEYKAKTKG